MVLEIACLRMEYGKGQCICWIVEARLGMLIRVRVLMLLLFKWGAKDKVAMPLAIY